MAEIESADRARRKTPLISQISLIHASLPLDFREIRGVFISDTASHEPVVSPVTHEKLECASSLTPWQRFQGCNKETVSKLEKLTGEKPEGLALNSPGRQAGI